MVTVRLETTQSKTLHRILRLKEIEIAMDSSDSMTRRADHEMSGSWKIHTFLTAMGVLVLLTISYMAHNSERMSRVHAPLVDAAMEVKLGCALAHLWLEEITAGDTSVDMQEVWESLQRAEWFAKAMLEGGENDEGVFISLDDPKLKTAVEEVIVEIAQFTEITKERLAALSTSGIGSELDQEYDRVFQSVLQRADNVETVLQNKIAGRLKGFDYARYALIAMTAGLFLLAGIILRKYEQRRLEAFVAVSTARRGAEMSEQWLSTTMNCMGDAVIATDSNSRVSYMNPVASRLTGWPAEEAIGQAVGDVFTIINEVTHQPMESPVDRVIRERAVVGLANHTVLIDRDGISRPIADSGAPILGKDGTLLGVVLVFHDVTEARKAELALRESEQQLRNIVESSPMGIYTYELQSDERLVLTSANPAADLYTGITNTELIGKTIEEAFPRLAETDVPDQYRRAAAEGEACYLQDLQYEGEFIQGAFDICAFQTSPRKMAVIFQEVTGRRRTAEALARSQQRLSLHVQQTPLAVIEWDRAFEVVEWNPAAEAIFGFTREEALGRHPTEFLLPDSVREQVDEVLVNLMAQEGGLRNTNKNTTKSGKIITCEWYNTPLVDEHGETLGVASLAQDITDRLEAQTERETLIEELETKNAELERFTYTVSHDLKSPLITIKGFLGMLRRDIESGDSELMESDMSRIASAAEKMQRLLDELLDLSRVGRLINPSEDVALSVLAEEAVELVAGRITEGGIATRVAPDLPVIHGDRPRLFEVMQNLIDNAAKFMGDQAEPTIEIGSRRDGNKTVCFVRDNGLGIDPRYHDKVFSLFDQLDQAAEGTGVGLALVKRIIQVHGGCIWVESEGPGTGCTFCFVLPWKAESMGHEE